MLSIVSKTSKKAKNLCRVKGCSLEFRKRDILCGKHAHKRLKDNDIVSYTYTALKSNAKRRGKVFTITLDYFRQFCKETDYIALKGIYKDSATIDRIDDCKGYEPDNIRVITNGDNVRKQRQRELLERKFESNIKESVIDVSDIISPSLNISDCEDLPF